MFWPNSEYSLESRTQPESSSSSSSTIHQPVLLREVIEYLHVLPGKNYVDLTVGGGGHSHAILERSGPEGLLVGADRDPSALKRAGTRLVQFGHRVKLLYGALEDVRATFTQAQLDSVDGVLIDCGLSSDQLDDSRRGFSFSGAGPLDMRMDPTKGVTAIQWLSRQREEELANTIFEYGEERYSRRIARAIVAALKRGTVSNTADLAQVIAGAIPGGRRSHSIHPATRSFQAIRIAVNDELNQLESALDFLLKHLQVGARIVVISFHSLEDRIVKTAFRIADREGRGRILTKKPIRPTEDEADENPRARSARLRAIEIIGGQA